MPLASTFKEELHPILKQIPGEIDAVFSSPSQRCTQLAAELSPSFITDEDLYEMSFGAWEGQTWDSINREESEYWLEDFLNRSPPEGECLKEMYTRVMRFWKKLLRSNAERVVIATHAGVIKLILCHLNNSPLESFPDIKIEFGEVRRVKSST